MKDDSRPINVGISGLMAFRWPVAAVASIAHRVSGVALFAGVAFALFALDLSLSGEDGFNSLRELIGSPLGKFITWALLSALAYHFVAGVRHLLMDMGIGESLVGGKVTAWLAIALSAVLIALAAVWVA